MRLLFSLPGNDEMGKGEKEDNALLLYRLYTMGSVALG